MGSNRSTSGAGTGRPDRDRGTRPLGSPTLEGKLSVALETLVRQVREVRDELPKDKRQLVEIDLGTLVHEASSPAPRREHLAIAIEGLRQAEWPRREPVLGAIDSVCSTLGI